MRYEKSILELVNTSNSHMTAEQVFFALKQNYPSVVLATVYNNLNHLCQQGRIRKISVEGCPDRYDKQIRHDHLVCRRCAALRTFISWTSPLTWNVRPDFQLMDMI